MGEGRSAASTLVREVLYLPLSGADIEGGRRGRGGRWERKGKGRGDIRTSSVVF